MSGKIIKIGNPHYCEKPNLGKWRNRKLAVEGTQWQCDDCQKVYEVEWMGGMVTGFIWSLIKGEK